VSQLRAFLTELFDHITELNGTDDTEYEDDDDDADAYVDEDTPEPETGGEGDDDDEIHAPRRQSPDENVAMYRGHRRHSLNLPQSHEFVFRRDRPIRGATIPPTANSNQLPPSANIQGATSRLNAQILAAHTPGSSPRPSRGQGQGLRSMADMLPIIESSASPPPSDVASNRSEGANQTNGAGFFRLLEEGGSPGGSSQNNGTQTPELNFAEIGHGRGTNGAHSSTLPSRHLRRAHNAVLDPRQPFVDDHRPLRTVPLPQSQTEVAYDQTPATILPVSVHQHQSTSQPRSPSVVWPYREPNDPSTILISSTRDLHEPVQPVPSTDGRGRSVKRSFRNTLNVAEHYASSFLFGRPPNGQDDNSRGGGSGSVGGR
jgi:F-box and leucine-rich repeat protein GRR1